MHPFDRYAAFTDLTELKAASERPLRKTMRVNLLKCTVERFQDWAKEKGWKLSPVPWCAEAFFVDREDRSVALGKDLLHLLGHTYMQEASSMLPVSVLDPQPGETILDMSAAPGSKSTQMASLMGDKGIIVCNDVQEKRLWTLKSSLYRCGVTNYVMTKKVGQWFSKHFTERFDRVLCDAPCTAQGTSRKDSDALEYSSLENVGKMAKLQRELLQSAIDAAKVGGCIVYSTCTLTPEENEDVIHSILEKNQGALEIVDPRTSAPLKNWKDIARAIEDSAIVQKSFGKAPIPMLRLWPHAYDTEGFFAAILRKTAPTRPREKMDYVRYQEEELPKSRVNALGKLCQQQYGASFLRENERLYIRGDQLLLSTEEIVRFGLPVENYALGIPFAKSLGNDRIRLSHETLTLRGNEATKNVVDIDDAQFDLLFDGKDTTVAADLQGDVIVRYKGVVVGSSLAQNGTLKNRLPRWLVVKS
jgi:16S rRNA (cytosine1407-C5)-methyltransferase